MPKVITTLARVEDEKTGRTGDITIRISEQCDRCVHYKPPFACAAFPDGIPPEMILEGRHDHVYPYPGDHGILFEKNPRID